MSYFVDLFLVALMPVLNVLLVTATGLLLALDTIDILGNTASHHLNKIVFYVFNPAFIGISLAKSLTLENLLALWFLPVNILLTFVIGSILGWILGKVITAPNHVKCVSLASCSAGNYLALPLVIIPAMCDEKSSLFGAPDVCEPKGLAYASLSMAIGVLYFWIYVYNIVRIFSKGTIQDNETRNSCDNGKDQTEEISVDIEVLPRLEPCLTDQFSSSVTYGNGETYSKDIETSVSSPGEQFNSSTSVVNITAEDRHVKKMASGFRVMQCLKITSKKLNLKKAFSPSIIGAIVGCFIAMIPQIKKQFIGKTAPLRVISDSSTMIGEACIPSTVLLLGANLLKGLKDGRIQLTVIIGIVTIRYIILPPIGILIVKAAVRVGFVQSQELFYQFVLMLHYALPPAMNIGTVCQQFGIGQRECSVIMLWTNALASVAVTLWCTLFSWLVTY